MSVTVQKTWVGCLIEADEGSLHLKKQEMLDIMPALFHLVHDMGLRDTPQPKPSQDCATCKHAHVSVESGAMTCRHNAPIDIDLYGVAMWPRVSRTDSCGDWGAK